MSHAVTVKTQFKETDAFGRAAVTLGGSVIGQGEHALFSSRERGFAVQLPGWQFPIIAREDGTLAFDDYHGQWGNRADIDRLKGLYAIERTRLECERLCWACEVQADGSLLVYHPSGGTLTVTGAGAIDASGFTGPSCSLATAPLAAALGVEATEDRKAEYNQAKQNVGQG